MGGPAGTSVEERRVGTSDAVAPVASPRRSPTWRWIYDAPHDLVISLAWIPVFVGVALFVSRVGTSQGQLAVIVAATLFVSALHQPLTLGLVYGDPQQRSTHAAIFRWAPVVVVATVVTASLVVPLLVIPVAAVWNTVHTVQQRYGLGRIYARKSGYGSARVDRVVLYGAMVAAILAVAARPDLIHLVEQGGLEGRNEAAVRALATFGDVSAWLVWPALVFVVVAVGVLVRVEIRAGARSNPARWLYLGSSLALIATLVVNPAAGFVAYVSAHAIEYIVVVHRTAERRGADPAARGAIARTKGRPLAITACMVAVMAPVAVMHLTFSAKALSIGLAILGALHFLYDGLIWKLRKPAVANEFAIATGGV